MRLGAHGLRELTLALANNPALERKRDVQRVARALRAQSTEIQNGDDAAAIPDGSGYILLAAEGMLPAFVASDPFFAGFCAVMTNVGDIAAMGGRALAIVDVLFADEQDASAACVLEGLAHAARVFCVPVVGGHTSRSLRGSYLAAAVVGRAQKLITSFDARPGDRIVVAVDLHGGYRGASANFDAASEADPAQLRARLALLPELAEAGLVHAGKDVSMAGLPGTLLMLLETSGCGATLDLSAVPAPAGAELEPLRWLCAFPSYGYVLAVAPAHVRSVIERFEARGVHASDVGEVEAGHALDFTYDGKRERYYDLADARLLGFSPNVGGARHA